MKTDKTINIKNLIALCYIIDELSSFNDDIKELYMNNIYNDTYTLCVDISKISKHEYVFGKKNIKNFYLKNKFVIDNIQNYVNIQDFIYKNYNSNGDLNYNITYFYNYLKNHKNEINNILELLYRLKKLGFSELMFDPSMDFTKNDYEMDINFGRNFNIYYLENMEVIPNYDKNTIKFKTLASNYEIKVKPYLNNGISNSDRIIKLNSLTFDLDKLPKELSKWLIFDEVLSLKKENYEELVINSVELSVSVYDLKKQFDITEQVIKEINGVADKKELAKVLITMNKSINELLAICNKYDNKIEENNELITKELLEKEKQIYLRKRFYNSGEID